MVFPQLMAEVFLFKDSVSYNLRQVSQFDTRSGRTEYFERRFLTYIRPKIWELIYEA